jgi:hypothetical protein
MFCTFVTYYSSYCRSNQLVVTWNVYYYAVLCIHVRVRAERGREEN